MLMSMKIAGGAMGGVTLPIVIEFGAKGARIHESVPIKWSGAVGTGLGFFTGVLPAVWPKCPWLPEKPGEKEKENRNAIIAFGAANFATGVSILVLDELRKRAMYAFKNLPISLPGAEGLEIPPEQLIKEI